eukprot:7227755-Prymnesium_polylepis.1
MQWRRWLSHLSSCAGRCDEQSRVDSKRSEGSEMTTTSEPIAYAAIATSDARYIRVFDSLTAASRSLVSWATCGPRSNGSGSRTRSGSTASHMRRRALCRGEGSRDPRLQTGERHMTKVGMSAGARTRLSELRRKGVKRPQPVTDAPRSRLRSNSYTPGNRRVECRGGSRAPCQDNRAQLDSAAHIGVSESRRRPPQVLAREERARHRRQISCSRRWAWLERGEGVGGPQA